VVFGGRQLRDVLLVTGRRPGPIEETIAEHANIAGLVADAASAEDAKRTIAKAVDIWGRVDSLVNNAGAGAILPLADTTADRVMDIFSVNVLGLPHLRATRGTVVNVSSTGSSGIRPQKLPDHFR
jgi:NAD(P)-dependent dehydrogenase (short-subunit alcohol dehydrogenase family)